MNHPNRYSVYTTRVPSGRVHEAINLSVLGLGIAGYMASKDQLEIPEPMAIAFVGSYLLGSLLITPDLDLAEQNVRAKGRWGLLGLFWVPYGWMFSHRGLSHTWVVGPLTRLLYLGTIGILLFWLLEAILRYWGASLNLRPLLQVPPQNILWSLVAGYYVSQWMHLIADGVWPDTGRVLGGRGRRR